MFNEPNLELVVLCVTLLIETSIRPDLTEMLRPYSQTCKVMLLYIKTRSKSNYPTTFDEVNRFHPRLLLTFYQTDSICNKGEKLIFQTFHPFTS
mgnify:CR=1 FL=1